ncbi:hypothetical protein DIPPA_29604 [Diplonema papillatum]|nr:hypothetical protein DIPPA_29604 [Diplonema papillatum]
MGSVMEVVFELDPASDKMYGVVTPFTAFTVEGGDSFEYEMMWYDIDTNANVDIEASLVSWRLRDDDSIKDQNSLINHCEKTDLEGLARFKWYRRRFPLEAAVGKYVNTLLFSANPGVGKTVKMLVKFIRLFRKNSVVEIWNSAMPPLTARPYFPGQIHTACKNDMLLWSNTSCRSVLDDTGKTRNGSTTIPAVFGHGFECNFSVGVEKTEDSYPSLTFTGARVEVKHERMPSGVPLLVDYMHAAETAEFLTPDRPIDVSINFTYGDAQLASCCPDLVLQTFGKTRLSITLVFKDVNTNADVDFVALAGPTRQTCFSFEDVEEEGAAEDDVAQQDSSYLVGPQVPETDDYSDLLGTEYESIEDYIDDNELMHEVINSDYEYQMAQEDADQASADTTAPQCLDSNCADP